MLQQTQVSRVIPKYRSWLEAFPRPESLARAPLSAALSAWSGLGYNRRAKWLRESASVIVEKHQGRVPEGVEDLDALPGVGPYTARAVSAFAFGKPEVFIETNIRRVFIHFFFSGHDGPVEDRLVLPLVERSLDREDPRTWYWALMDYGAALGTRLDNPNRRSASYVRQAPLKGSLREARGAILRILSSGERPWPALLSEAALDEPRLEKAARDLAAEGMIEEDSGLYRLCP